MRTQKQSVQAIKLLILIIILVLIIHCINSQEIISDHNKTEKFYQKKIPEITHEETQIQSLFTNDDCLFISTLDGHIHAYSSINEKLWSVNLGKPLISSTVNTHSIIEGNSILPGLDGNIYLYTEKDEKPLKKIEIPLKTLIDNSPFTLPNMPNYIFIGDKKSSMYTIDVSKGIIVTKHTSNEEDDNRTNRPIQSDNLLTVIRIDYTLTSINEKEGSKSWNMTVSEIMAIQKGSKSELTLKKDMDVYNSRINEKINDIIVNNDKSIVAIHKFNGDKNTPIKIYDYKRDNNFEEFFNFNRNLTDNITDYYRIYDNYIKWTSHKNYNLVDNKTIFHSLIFKFWEMYYFDDFFFLYFSVILTLILFVVVLIYLIIKYVRKNSILKRKLKEFRKISDDKKNQAIVLKNNYEEKVLDCDNKLNNSQEVCLYKDNPNCNIVKTNSDFIFNSMVDLNLKNHEKENEALTNVKLYQSSDGSLIKEEYKMLRTKFENNEEVKSRFIQFENEMEKINQLERKRTYSENYNQSITKNNRTKEIKSGFSIHAIQDKTETKILLKPLNEEEKSKVHISKRKYNYKEYNMVHQSDDIHKIMKINTTYIDEGRLEKNFEGFEKIGQGGFGSVFKAKHKIDDSLYAIKMIKLKVAQSRNLMDYKEIKEVKTMMKLNHKNVVRYYTCWFQLHIDGIKSDCIESESVTQSCLRSMVSGSKPYTITKKNESLPYISEYTDNDIIRNNEKWNWDSKSKKSDSIVFVPVDKALSISLEKEQDDIEIEESIHSYDESQAAKKIKHKEQLYDVFFFMQMEFCDGLPLNEYLEINRFTGLSRKLIFSFFKQIVSGVNHIHKNKVIHRDLKPHNIFIFGENSIKIGDFGLAIEIGTNMRSSVQNLIKDTYHEGNPSIRLTQFVGTPLYLSPEQIEGLNYNEKVDIFAMGLILYEICAGFKTGMERRESLEMLRNDGKLKSGFVEMYEIESELILWMTRRKFWDRPSAQEIIDSNVFKNWKNKLNNY